VCIFWSKGTHFRPVWGSKSGCSSERVFPISSVQRQGCKSYPLHSLQISFEQRVQGEDDIVAETLELRRKGGKIRTSFIQLMIKKTHYMHCTRMVIAKL